MIYIDLYIPGTQMTLVLNGKGLLLEGSNPKIEDKQVPGIYISHLGKLKKIIDSRVFLGRDRLVYSLHEGKGWLIQGYFK